MLLEGVYQQMRWLEAETGLLPFVGLALELGEGGVVFPKVVGRLEHTARGDQRVIVHRISEDYPNINYRTLEAVCVHLLYELEKMATQK